MGIAQDTVSLADPGEALSGSGIEGVEIRVMGFRQPAIRSLDRILVSGCCDPEQIKVSPDGCGRAASIPALLHTSSVSRWGALRSADMYYLRLSIKRRYHMRLQRKSRLQLGSPPPIISGHV